MRLPRSVFSGQDEWLEAVSVFVDVNSIKAGTTNACGTSRCSVEAE
jgi:hypothetical protein